MNKTDTFVVGQGIAGTMVAYMLHQRHIPFMVIDTGFINTASRIAAGMFTPVSGKRKTIHPIVPQQISFAIKTYKAMELLLGATILHQQNIYQVYHTMAEREEMVAKSARVDFEKYILTDPAALPYIKQETGACEITHSGWVNCGLMISAFAGWLQQKGALLQEEFLYHHLHVAGGTAMEYHGWQFNQIIFCEGYQAINNPFFKTETIVPCKGNVLTVEYAQPVTGCIVKRDGVYLVPAGNNIYRAGSTYQWNDHTVQPDEAGKKLLEEKLTAMLENDFTTIGHQAAIRPTTQNREVIAKQHPQHKGMYMLNGLGTKGVLQGPWWAKHVVETMEEERRFKV